jgi:exosortase/archaeosortase family protein
MNRYSQWHPFAWLGLQVLVLWPHAAWYGQRIADGSDDPLGVVALAAIGVLAARLAPQLKRVPDLRWMALAAVLTATSTVALLFCPPLLCSLLAVLALTAGLVAWLPASAPRLPYAGLMVLALPLLSSLQFYVGYPLRLVTAQLSAWLLQAGGMAAQRSGASMIVDGQLVIVDAPCSGVQMAWMAYFTAMVMAAVCGVRDTRLLRRLPFVSLLVLAGNTLRNSILVSMEAKGAAPTELVHQGTGLVVLAAVCLFVLWLVRQEKDHALPVAA